MFPMLSLSEARAISVKAQAWEGMVHEVHGLRSSNETCEVRSGEAGSAAANVHECSHWPREAKRAFGTSAKARSAHAKCESRSARRDRQANEEKEPARLWHRARRVGQDYSQRRMVTLCPWTDKHHDASIACAEFTRALGGSHTQATPRAGLVARRSCRPVRVRQNLYQHA